MPLFEQIVWAVSYCSVGYHLWTKRQTLRKDLGAAAAWLLEFLVGLVGALPCTPSAGGKTDRAADEEWVHEQMDELRLQHIGTFAQIGTVVLSIMLVAMSLVWGVVTIPFLRTTMPVVQCPLLLTHIILLGITSGGLRVTRSRVNCMYGIINLAFCVRLFLAPANPHFYTLQSARFVFRVILGIIVMDMRATCIMNSLWTATLIRHQVVKLKSIVPDGGGELSPFVIVALELWHLVLLQGILLVVFRFVESHIRMNLGMIVARSVQRAVRRLLSVLCDAELHLTPGLEIQEPSHKVAFMLAPDQGNAGVATIEARSFIDFIAEADQSRFRGFMATSSGGTAGDEVGPAASIHLHLRDTTGLSFPVEIFHAKLPYSSGSGHLLGIRECGLVTKETAISFEPQGPTHGPGPLMPAELPPAPPPKAEDAVGKEPAPATLGNLCCPGQLSSGIFAQEFNNTRPEDSASVRSARTAYSVRPMDPLDLPELEMELRVDVLDKDLAVREFRCRFNKKSNPEQSQGPPLLRDWVHESLWEKFSAWVQTNLNAAMNGDPPGQPFGSLVFQWPSSGGGGEDLFLEATKMTIDVSGPGGTDSSEESEEECEDDGEEAKEQETEDTEGTDEEAEEGFDELLAVVKLKGFKQYVVPRGRPRPHRPRSHLSHNSRHSRHSSNKSRPVQQLPAIEEAKAGQRGSNSDNSGNSGKVAAEVEDHSSTTNLPEISELPLDGYEDESPGRVDRPPEGVGPADATASRGSTDMLGEDGGRTSGSAASGSESASPLSRRPGEDSGSTSGSAAGGSGNASPLSGLHGEGGGGTGDDPAGGSGSAGARVLEEGCEAAAA